MFSLYLFFFLILDNDDEEQNTDKPESASEADIEVLRDQSDISRRVFIFSIFSFGLYKYFFNLKFSNRKVVILFYIQKFLIPKLYRNH